MQRKRMGTVLLLAAGMLLSGCQPQARLSWEQSPLFTENSIIEQFDGINETAEWMETGSYELPQDVRYKDISWVGTAEPKAEGRHLRIGFSQMEVNNDWRIYENASLFQSAQAAGAELLYRDAEGQHELQCAQIEELIAEEVDYLVVAPRQETGFAEVLDKAKEAGIPVIMVDRITNDIAGKDYLTCIMGDFCEIGERAAKILAEAYPDRQLRVLIVSGSTGSSVAGSLTEGFLRVADPLGWHCVQIDGDFERNRSINEIEKSLIDYHGKIDAIFCHIDDSAIAAIQALKSAGLTPGVDMDAGEIPIVSMGGYKDALKAIIAGEMLATIECSPRLGPILFRVIRELEQGLLVPSRIAVPGRTYDIHNAEHYIGTEGY